MFFLANGVGKKSAHPIAETGSLVHIYIYIFFNILSTWKAARD